ncbi:MAG: Efflux ABC transporter, permease protein [Parcubacteria group bacterium GW2011_GWA2_45_30]|nr:MAG: Efflux ABC transporter, permease protein [Parcubacteria group bacterium GW2011_GWA2_45_30]
MATLKRILKTGFLNFKRNGWLSAATVMVMVLSLFVLGNLIFLSAFATTILAEFKSKIDVSVYFTEDAPEENIFAVKKDLESHPDVAEVAYISRSAALTLFRERHKDEELISQALEELGENPLQASLNIRAKNPSQYAAISEFLSGKKYPVVEKINYFENKLVIERLSSILNSVRGGGSVLVLVLSIIAVLVSFNTIRMAIFTMREEIGIMRLVGAARWFIRGPFLVSGVLYGASAALLTLLIFFPLVWLISPRLILLMPSFDLFQYFLLNFFEFAAVLFGTGVLIGVFSSFLAVRKYLDI